ncbi:MAG: integrase core domain-containing protein [Nitrosomonas sp.]|nr:MAG: integrase core domain-containing protein [Nitrosomonas sp.]
MMKVPGIISTAPKPKTSHPNKQHKTYPDLLKGTVIDRPNQVWAADITYVPMQKGFGYLIAMMDWYSRKVLSWRLSNMLDTDFCELLYTQAFDNLKGVRQSLTQWFGWYNHERFHQSLNNQTPDEVYCHSKTMQQTA